MQVAGSRLRLSVSGRAATAPGLALGLPFGLRESTQLSSGPSMAAATGDARASAGSTPTPAKTGRSSKASLRSFAISAIGRLCWVGSRDAGRTAASRSIRRTGASSSFAATGSGAAGWRGHEPRGSTSRRRTPKLWKALRALGQANGFDRVSGAASSKAGASSTFAKTPPFAREQKHASRRRFAAMAYSQSERGIGPAISGGWPSGWGRARCTVPRWSASCQSNMRTAPRSGRPSQLRKVPRVFACNRRVYDTAHRRQAWQADAVFEQRDQASAQWAAMTRV